MKPDPVLGMLSLAAKAGRIKSGSFMAEKSIKSGRARVVIVARDASDNTKKKFKDACAYRSIRLYEYSDQTSLGKYVGKGGRVVIAIEDEGFSESIIKKFESIPGL